MHVLLGAFEDEGRVIPVQLEVKEFKKTTNEDHKLHMAVILGEIKAGISPRALNTSNEGEVLRSPPAYEYSVPEIIDVVNDETGGFIKYIPDSLLSEDQIEAKRRALKKDNKRLETMRQETE